MTAVPLNTLSPRGTPIATDLLPILPAGAQILESMTWQVALSAISTYLATNPAPSNKAIVYVIDGGGSAITTGVHGALYLPFAVTISSASLLADQTGSCVIDIGQVAIASYTGAFTGSITASDMPTLSSTVEYLDTTLTGWTLAIAAGTVLIFKVVSTSTITRLTITLGGVG